jgi:hypothetical protein
MIFRSTSRRVRRIIEADRSYQLRPNRKEA